MGHEPRLVALFFTGDSIFELFSTAGHYYPNDLLRGSSASRSVLSFMSQFLSIEVDCKVYLFNCW